MPTRAARRLPEAVSRHSSGWTATDCIGLTLRSRAYIRRAAQPLVLALLRVHLGAPR